MRNAEASEQVIDYLFHELNKEFSHEQIELLLNNVEDIKEVFIKKQLSKKHNQDNN